MRGQPFAILQRALDNVIANWELVLLRIGEGFILAFVVIIGIVAAIVPLVIAGVMASNFDFEDADAFRGWAFAHLPLVIVAVIIALLFMLVALAVHAFAQAGVTGCYIEGEKRARAAGVADRVTLKSFSIDLWWRHAVAHGMSFFGIYVVMGVLVMGAIVLTAAPFAAAAYAARGNENALVFASCAGAAAVLLVFLLIATVAGVLSRAGAVQVVVRGVGAFAALRAGLSMIFRRFGDVALVTIALWALSLAAAMLFGGVYFGFGVASSIPVLSILTIPAQIGMSVIQNVLSFFIAGWLTSSYAAIALEEEESRHVAV